MCVCVFLHAEMCPCRVCPGVQGVVKGLWSLFGVKEDEKMLTRSLKLAEKIGIASIKIKIPLLYCTVPCNLFTGVAAPLSFMLV